MTPNRSQQGFTGSGDLRDGAICKPLFKWTFYALTAYSHEKYAYPIWVLVGNCKRTTCAIVARKAVTAVRRIRTTRGLCGNERIIKENLN